LNFFFLFFFGTNTVMKVVIAVLLFACLSCFVNADSCDPLLNCKICADEYHCKTCKDGWKLDSKKVCRFDCASKFGENCTTCTEKKCICPSGYEWNITLGKCVDVVSCTSKDGAACEYCGKEGSNDLIDIDGECASCEEAFGEGCLTCSYSHCLTVDEGFKLVGALSVEENCTQDCPEKCEDLFPGCEACDSNLSKCVKCENGTAMDNGFCKFEFPTCEPGNKTLYIDDEIQCGVCTDFDSACIPNRCNGRGCTTCRTGFTVNEDGGCSNCTKLFPGCGICSFDGCSKCRSSQWTLTPNGCINQKPYVDPEESKGGMIAGIVIAAIFLVAVIIVAVYCIITASAKKGAVDPSVYEEDFEFKSMSVL